MKFTIVFPSHESRDVSIGVVFIPGIVWIEGKREILNPHPQKPDYLQGDLQYFFKSKGEEVRKNIATHSNKVAVVVHPTGHGTEEDLNNLLHDLKQERFEPEVTYL